MFLLTMGWNIDEMGYPIFKQSHNVKIFKRLPLEAEVHVRNVVRGVGNDVQAYDVMDSPSTL